MPDATAYDTAATTLFQRVFVPAFFAKLASCGIEPQNEKEALDLVSLADKIRYTDELELSKAGSAQAQLVSHANGLYDHALGLTQQPPRQSWKKEAGELSADPEIHNAALLYQDGIRQLAGG